MPENISENFFKKWASLIVLSLALAVIVIDTTILNVALSSIIRDLKTNIQSIQWVITSYALMLAAFTILGGRLGDFFGRKKMFIVGAITFAIGSFLASISTNVGLLIAGESIIEGIGAALMMPATASLLVSNFKGRDRAIAFGIWGGVAAASSAIGPILGGYLTSHYSWRWAFRINIFVVLLLVLSSFLIKDAKDTEEKPSLDLFGVIISSLSLLSIVFGLIKASDYGWFTAKQQLVLFGQTLNLGSLSAVPLFILAGVIGLIAFIFWEKHLEAKGGTPLVSLELFKNRQFTSGSIVTASMSVGFSGMIFALPVFFQAVRGYDAFHTGMALLPMSLALLVGAPFSAFISKKVKPKYLVQTGLVVGAAGLLVTMFSLHLNSTILDMIPGLVIYGFGMGLVFAQINNIVLSAVSVQQSGEASGVNNTFRQLGTTLGSAIIGTILLINLTANLSTKIAASAVIPNSQKTFISTAAQAQISKIEFGGSLEVPGNLQPAILKEVKNIGDAATTEANRSALLFSAIFTLISFILSFFIPNMKNIETEQSAAHNEAVVAEVPAAQGPVPIAAEMPAATKTIAPMPTTAKISNSANASSAGLGMLPVVIALLLVGSAGAFGGYLVGRKSATNSNLVVATSGNRQDNTAVHQNNPEVLGITNSIDVASSPAAPANSAPSNTKNIYHPATGGNAVTPSTVGQQLYVHNQFGIKFYIPVNWQMQENISNNYDATFISASNNVASMHVDVDRSDDISAVRAAAVADQNNQIIKDFTVGGAQAFEYRSAATNENIVVFKHNNNVFFLHAALTDDSTISTVQLF